MHPITYEVAENEGSRVCYDHHVEERVSLGARMRRGLRNLCQGDYSSPTTTTRNPKLEQEQVFLFNNTSCSIKHHRRLHHDYNYINGGGVDDEEEEEEKSAVPSRQHPPTSPNPTTTLEEMIMLLDLEEQMAARNRNKSRKEAGVTRRMSCVNTSSDRVLRSARNALNQYPPRFSLDGKDAMYRSSFLNDDLHRHRRSDAQRRYHSGGGSNVVWCKPGVVPKLMGLDAIPVPVNFPGGPLFFRKRRYGDDEDDDVLIDRVIRPSLEVRR